MKQGHQELQDPAAMFVMPSLSIGTDALSLPDLT